MRRIILSDQDIKSMEAEKPIPKIEEEILEGDVRETALEFADYLNEHNMAPQQWFGPTIWKIPYGEKYLCGIFMNRTGKFRECPKGITTVFGKEIENTCFQFPIQFENPKEDTLECIKALIEYWKEVIPPGDSWHAR